MVHMRKAAQVAVLAATLFAMLGALGALGSAGATTLPNGTTAETLQLGAVTGPGTVTVSVDVPQSFNELGIPTQIVEEPLATIPLAGGGTQQIAVPVTGPTVQAATNSSGLAQFDFVARFGNQVATSTASLPVATSPSGQLSANSALVRDTTGTPITFSQFSVAPAGGGPDAGTVGCIKTLDGTWELSPRLGQMQDSTAGGSSVRWTYGVQADSSFDVGVSLSPTSGYSAGGNVTVSNSIGASGGFTAGAGYNWYVDGHMYQVRYYGSPSYACGWSYQTYFHQAVGDSFTGTNQPSLNPWSRCGNDPYGLATVQNGGFYEADRGQAVSYSAVATFWNFSVGGHTGYSSNIYIHYTNNSGGPEYVCGTNYLPNAPILYSNSLSGH
jgi:hypothetical protein